MAKRTMKELLRAPTEGYREAIVIPEINADHFEIKTNFLQLVQASPFQGFERDNPHTHINNFKRITSTLKFRNVPNDVIILMMFPYSLEGNARIWYEKEPPNSILTWEDLTFNEAWERFKEMLRACPHHGFLELTQVDTFYNGLNDNDQDSLNVAAGGNLLSKTTREDLNIIENKSKVHYSQNKSNVSRMNTTSRESVSKMDERIDKLADQISTLVEIVSKKVVTLAPVKAVEEIRVTCNGPHAWYNCPNTDNNQSSICAATGSTAHIPPPVNPIPIPEPDVPKTLPKPNIPYPLRHNDQKFLEKASNQMDEIFQIFQDLRFDISFADALLLMPRFAPTIKNLLKNKEKLFELAKIPLNENCSAMLLKKFPEKLGDPGKFLILCDFPGMDLISMLSSLIGDPLYGSRALIDVYGEVITLRVNDEAVTFNLNQTTRYSSTYDDMSINRIDVIDVAYEEYSQEVLGFSYKSSSGNPTMTFEPIISDSFLSFTPFKESDFILEEIEAYLKDDSISPEIDHADCDPEGDICLIEKWLNNDPFQLPSMNLKEVTKAKPSIEEPPELELKDLQSHLEYAYLEGTDKLPVIIAKGLKDDEK
ncbi:hypothetical protein Tco_0938893 [Tanacetum coccineum]|uniref:Reverse transcriptase domain-containing protein n=1 Tax=Tanacetum coccineum TaxID=301880 RepID=A0ABQ5DL57_9ASTR